MYQKLRVSVLLCTLKLKFENVSPESIQKIVGNSLGVERDWVEFEGKNMSNTIIFNHYTDALA